MPAIGTGYNWSLTMRDYSGETKAMTFPVAVINDTTLPTRLTEFQALQDAIEDVTLGQSARERWWSNEVISNARAAVANAQVETEMLVRMRGAVNQEPFSMRLTCVDYTAFNYADPPAGDQVLISGAGASAETLALIAAIEAVVTVPGDPGESAEVVGMEVVQ